MNGFIKPLDKRGQLLAAGVALASQAAAVLAMGLITGWKLEPTAPSQAFVVVAYTLVSSGISLHVALLDMARRKARL